ESADPYRSPVTWRDAITVVPRTPRVVVVVDSLQTWAESPREQTALMQSLRALRPSPRATGATVLVISHATKKGDAVGRNTNQHSGDANVTVDASSITVTKCRWTPCPSILPRRSSTPDDSVGR